MWLFKKKKEQDLNKRYLSTGDKRYDDNDILELNEVYEVFKKYHGYEKIVDLSDGDAVYKKVENLMSELVDLGILCNNYEEFGELYNNYREFPIDKTNELGILECMVLITAIQRSVCWSGTFSNVYLGYTKSGLIPQIIDRVISLYENRVKQV